MRRSRRYDDTKISFTLTRAGCRESAPVELSGREFDELANRIKRKGKRGPLTKPQAEAEALFEEFVKRGLGLK